MARRILVNQAGETHALLVEDKARNEQQLHSLLLAHPELLPIEDFGLEGPLLVVGKETVLASGQVDLVGVTAHGEILIIEFKTGPENPDFRSALAQLLDYGSDLHGMDLKVFEETVAVRYFKGQHCTPEFHGCDSLAEAAAKAWPQQPGDEEFQALKRLPDVLSAGSFNFVVVAQRFTPAMERTARYLNGLNPSVRFHLVEMVRFVTGSSEAFEARTVLTPSRTAAKGSFTYQTEVAFLNGLASDEQREMFADLFDIARGLSLRFEWGSTGTSIRMPTPEKSEPISVAWVFPPGAMGWMGLRDLTFGYDPAQAAGAPTTQAALDTYLEAIGKIPNATPVTKGGLKAYSFTPEHFSEVHETVKEPLATLVNATATQS